MNSTVQLLELAVAGASTHGSSVTVATDPVGWLVKVKSTDPIGALLVPLAVSVTVTVQLAGLFAGVGDGQSRTVDVPRAVTVIMSAPLLPLCSEPGVGL